MSSPIDGDAVLPHEFYVQQGAGLMQAGVQPALGISTDSSISHSQRTALELGYDPSIPTLVLPLLSFNEYNHFLVNGRDYFSAIGTPNGITQEGNAEMIRTMLDKWSESLDQIKQQRIDKEKSLNYLIVQQAAREMMNGNIDSAMMAMAIMIISSSFVGAVGVSKVGGVVHYHPVASAIHSMRDLLQNDMINQMGAIGTYFALMASFQLALINPAIDKMQIGMQKKSSPEGMLAQRYASVIIGLMSDPSFHNFLVQRVISQVPRADTLTQDQQLRMAVVIKIVLLMTALAAIYKKDTGHLTDLEIAAYLKGEMKLQPGDIEGLLAGMINAHLSLLPVQQRASLIEHVLEYLNSNPDVSALTDPAKSFEAIFKNVTQVPVGDQSI